ncbi:hypothetical protein ACSDR0_44155 [Streptosporangium sp. G11]|uniref:hypothetical protein n=1 Tax=Streptosporangium sp. G11 TaxID=3436926 RepID=UPI003EC0323B
MTVPTALPAGTHSRTVTTTMSGRELRLFFGAVLPHASTDDTLPPITMLTLDVAGGVLHALATDRYTLGIARHPLPSGTPGAFTLGVPAAAVRAVISHIKLRASVELTLSAEALTIDQFDPQVRYHLPASDARPVLPDWRTWLAERLTATPEPVLTAARGIVLNPTYLARFRSAPRDGLGIEMRPAGRCMVITCGTHFLGLVMPMDLSKVHAEAPDPLTGWLPTPPSSRQNAA